MQRASGRFVCFLIGLSTLVWSGDAHANTIAENTAGTDINVASGYLGQSFTTGSGSFQSNITFNFFSNVPATTPYAVGTGFLLGMQYLGSPSGLTSSAPGFLGEANASGGFYTFDPSLILLPNTQYFFYENAAVPINSESGGNIYAGGQNYFTSSASGNFVAFSDSNNFRVTGTPINA